MLKLNPLTKQILNKYSLSHAKTIKERDKVINFQKFNFVFKVEFNFIYSKVQLLKHVKGMLQVYC